jgi:light-regulated signal transduction histidine kinase (bacteriophytochrome)
MTEAKRNKEEELKEELQHILYVVSHDLGKYVNHMREFTKILLEEASDKFSTEEKEYADMLVRAANLSEGMILALLTYSRIETQGKPFEEVDQNEALEEALGNLHEQIEDAEAKVTAPPLPTVQGDKDQLVMVWCQLLHNALTYVDKGCLPEIEITIKEEPNFYVFGITDNGIGIDTKNHEKIFKLFKRLHLEDVYPGAGAGLAITKRILQRHGGDIEVASTLGKGAIFSFSLPKHAAS